VHIPGALWPVNNWSTENIHELFSINERVLVEIKTERGLVGVMFVGATNVGQIMLSFDSEVLGNQLLSSAVFEKKYTNLKVNKGDELGMFKMGSTVVMLYSPGCLKKLESDLFKNKPVRVNAAFSE
jgi:phosphatidylserine decarboxylase